MAKPGKPKIIIFDLETLPNLPEALKVWPGLGAYPGLTLKASVTSIICAGFKIYGQKKVSCINAWDFDEWATNVNDDKKLCQKIYEVLKDADAVVTHNGKRFDWKFLQTRLMAHGLDPLADLPHIDTKEVAKRHLFAFNNRLQTVGQLLAKDKKLAHEGWELWVKVHSRQKTAMKTMTRYCKQDVLLLEKVFKKLKPLINNIPNHNLWVDIDEEGNPQRVCPNCGSEKLYFNGWRHGKTVSYRRMRCSDCGSYARLNARGKQPRSI